MKRRRFVTDLLITPVVTAAAAAQTTPQTKPLQQPPPQPNTPARQVPIQPQTIPKLTVTQADLTAEGDQRFFSSEQYAALEKLAGTLMPPLNGHPGAVEAHAPEFLDFLISVSPADSQKLYCDGLDAINLKARTQFHKPFAELSPEDVDAIIRPLLVARFWPEDLPKDPLKNFVAQVHENLRTATENSREWVTAQNASGRRQRGSGGRSDITGDQSIRWLEIKNAFERIRRPDCGIRPLRRNGRQHSHRKRHFLPDAERRPRSGL